MVVEYDLFDNSITLNLETKGKRVLACYYCFYGIFEAVSIGKGEAIQFPPPCRLSPQLPLKLYGFLVSLLLIMFLSV